MKTLLKFLLPALVAVSCHRSPITLDQSSFFQGDPSYETCDSDVATAAVERGDDYLRFAVNQVKRATEPLATVSYQEAVTQQMLAKHRQAQLEDFSERDYELVPGGRHALLQAVSLAYAEHRPLVISPDMIWLLISQGFGVHVNENAEALRESFVNFGDKAHLDVERNNFRRGQRGNDWEGVFAEFKDKIAAYTGPEITQIVAGGFSTSSPIETAAFQIALLDAMDHYFSYSVSFLCGIPEITLEGTPEDWEAIEARVQALAAYDLSWWTDDLTPILHQFTEAAHGRVDSDFWSGIFQWQNAPDGCVSITYMTGWLVKFFPYLQDGSGYYRNPMVGSSAEDFLETYRQDGQTYQRYSGPMIELDDIPPGFATAKLLVNDTFRGEFYKLNMTAGFIGIQQDEQSLALRPEIAWAIVDTGEPVEDADIEQYHKTNPLPPETAVSKEE